MNASSSIPRALAAAALVTPAATAGVVAQSAEPAAAQVACSSTNQLGPPFVTPYATGVITHGIADDCNLAGPAVDYVHVATTLYKHNPTNNSWGKVDPPDPGLAWSGTGPNFAAALHSYVCDLLPQNFCYPALYKQLWQTSFAVVPPEVPGTGPHCSVDPNFPLSLNCSWVNYLQWDDTNVWNEWSPI